MQDPKKLEAEYRTRLADVCVCGHPRGNHSGLLWMGRCFGCACQEFRLDVSSTCDECEHEKVGLDDEPCKSCRPKESKWGFRRRKA